jgi:hypothetical protein
MGSDLLTRHYAVRWLTVLLYAASVGLIYVTASHALGHISGGAAGATTMALLQPMFAYMGSAINNDMAAVFLASAWFALAVPLFVESGEWGVGSRGLEGTPGVGSGGGGGGWGGVGVECRERRRAHG